MAIIIRCRYVVYTIMVSWNHNTGSSVTGDVSQDLDVDGHTNLDNVSIVGVTTTTDDIIIGADNNKINFWR